MADPLDVFRGAAAGAPPGEKLAAMDRAYTGAMNKELNAERRQVGRPLPRLR